MGIALACAAADFGAEVELVLGPVSLKPSDDSIHITEVSDAASMAEECLSLFPGCDIAILSAAVADYTPEIVSNSKIKKKGESLTLKLVPTTDIAAALGKIKRSSQVLAGFALETDNGLENARDKLKRKNLDLIVLNTLGEEGVGFGFDTNRITIIDRNNNIDNFELKSKEEAARDILDRIILILNNPA